MRMDRFKILAFLLLALYSLCIAQDIDCEGGFFGNKAYRVRITYPSEGSIKCETETIKVALDYSTFYIGDDSIPDPLVWTDCNVIGSSPAYGPEAFGNDDCNCTRNNRRHLGTDVALDVGDPIYSSFVGQVTRVVDQFEQTPGFQLMGRTVQIYLFEFDKTMLFGHLAPNIHVEEGDFICPGDLIAYGGVSGRLDYEDNWDNYTEAQRAQRYPHAHVEIAPGRQRYEYLQGTRETENPYPYIWGPPPDLMNGHDELAVILNAKSKACDDEQTATLAWFGDITDEMINPVPEEEDCELYSDPRAYEWEYILDYSGWCNGNVTLSCSLYNYVRISDNCVSHDSRTITKLCGNHTYIVQTGG